MKKIIAIIAALIFAVSLVFLSSDVFKGGNSGNELYSKVTIKDDTFTGDYVKKINGIQVKVEKGYTYSHYLEIKRIIEGTPVVCFEGIERIVLTPRHPYLAANKNPDEKLLKYVEEHPNTSGLYSATSVVGSKEVMGTLYLKDCKDYVNTYIHELAHHVDKIMGVNGKSISESDEFHSLCKAFTTKMSKNPDPIPQWFAKQSDSELFAYFAECIYVDDGTSYHKIVTSYPKIVKYYDDWIEALQDSE